MSEKRHDKRRRILRNGEDQRGDGRYRFSYTTADGTRKVVYSWKLEATDPLPAGKRDSLSLREQEKIIAQELEAEKQEHPECIVLELVKKYVAQKRGVRQSTVTGYHTVIRLLERDSFGKKSIYAVRVSDAKLWLIGLQTAGKSYSSIHSIRGVLRPAFQMAVEDDLLQKNPFGFELGDLLINDAVKREALTSAQERKFLEFVGADKHYSRYYDAIYILLNTGLRISEFCGLTIKDVNFKDQLIDVNHQLQRYSDMSYRIEPTKTDAGTRRLPMSNDVSDAFKRIVAMRKVPKIEPIIDGYTGFLFLDKNGMPMVAMHWEKYFQRIVEKYNKTYRVQLPVVTPHVCRHTYCTKMAKSGVSAKTLQYLMGHSDIGVTLNVYTHVKYEDAEKELKGLKKARNA